jgi:hypothetical protein
MCIIILGRRHKELIMSVSSKEGIVGFFDILGYMNFLENNEPAEAADIVVNTLLNIPEQIRTEAETWFGGRKERFIEGVQQAKWLIFSDTILLALPYDTEAPPEERFNQWTSFLLTSIRLFRKMFDHGLPLRGAIVSGSFVMEGSCFAGRTIIEAYRLAHSLDLSAIVLDHPAEKDVISAFEENNYGLQHMCFSYLVPLKQGKTERYMILSPTSCNNPFSGEIRQIIAESFWQHKKDVSPEVMSKFNNTEMYFRFVKMKHGHVFK